MALLIFVVMIRSWAALGFTTFVPFYYVDVLHADPRLVGSLLFVFLGAGAVGAVVAGPSPIASGAPVHAVGAPGRDPFGLLFLQSSGPMAFVGLGSSAPC